MVLGFVDPKKGARHYVQRYINEQIYRDWFHRNYPNHTIYQGIGIDEDEFHRIVDEITDGQMDAEPQRRKSGEAGDESEPAAANAADPAEAQAVETAGEQSKPDEDTFHAITDELRVEPKSETEAGPADKGQTTGERLAMSVFESYGEEPARRTFEEFVDERMLVSRDAFGKKEMKIKILEVSDEKQDTKIQWKFGDRVKVDRILVTVKHLDTMKVEEGEFDIKAIEEELARERHWTSTNRWIPASDIKNGYVVNHKHTALISDAVALDYIVF